jgi:CheY-like chemotaxis protein
LPIKARILVVAPDPSFRRSLAFVFEAEGCRVEVAEEVPSMARIASHYDCIVLDHRSIPSRSRRDEVLAKTDIPVILLASQPQDWVTRGFEMVVEKPLLGQSLVDAVHGILRKSDLRGQGLRG